MKDIILHMATTITVDYIELNKSYQDKCVNLIDRLNSNIVKSNVKAKTRTGWRIWEETNYFDYILKNITFKANSLSWGIAKSVEEDNMRELQVMDCWGASYYQDDWADVHNHQPYIMSFVYYIRAGSSPAPLIFNAADYQITPEDGLLVFFPSYMYHSVPKQQESSEPRTILAGNLSLV